MTWTQPTGAKLPSAAAHAGTEMGAVHLKVSDLERSVRYYTETIGLSVLNRYGGAARMTADGAYPLVVLEQVPNALVLPPGRNSGLYHFALLVPNRRDLGNVLKHLIRSQVRVGSADHDVSEALYLTDPDGIGIEIYRDRDRTEWKRMKSGEIYMSADPLDGAGLLREAEDGEWSGLPVGTRVGHVHLHVGDLRLAEAFYCGLLGFGTTLHYGSSALFAGAGGYHHHIGLNLWAGANAPPTPERATGLRYFTIVNPDPGHIERILEKLAVWSIEAETRGDGWYFRDPFGIGVRLTTCGIL
ncbi:VOC family protein [Cohnella thermotolerans]|uniref:VOC family protein n=1 Tax=Cohnella thermotolerans TaxID=329858 RepID=UPI0004242BA2|nr:VOC family protein [Cohnella thermotolerans]